VCCGQCGTCGNGGYVWVGRFALSNRGLSLFLCKGLTVAPTIKHQEAYVHDVAPGTLQGELSVFLQLLMDEDREGKKKRKRRIYGTL